MKLLVGLGNPGPEYTDTRHNAGFRVVERLAARHGIVLERKRAWKAAYGKGKVAGVGVGILEPLTYMNLSGLSVLRAIVELGIEDPGRDLVVVYDDLDLPFGRLRIRPGGGAGGHNGLSDIQSRLRRNDFPRLRFGIGRPPPGEDPVDYVLSPFDSEQLASLGERLEAAADALEALLDRGVETAMNQFNASTPPEP
jgi:PTH1 family peptidyl-tRNA hydrolase